MKQADDAYSQLDSNDARAYRRWAFATAPAILPKSRNWPALRVIQGGKSDTA